MYVVKIKKDDGVFNKAKTMFPLPESKRNVMNACVDVFQTIDLRGLRFLVCVSCSYVHVLGQTRVE